MDSFDAFIRWIWEHDEQGRPTGRLTPFGRDLERYAASAAYRLRGVRSDGEDELLSFVESVLRRLSKSTTWLVPMPPRNGPLENHPAYGEFRAFCFRSLRYHVLNGFEPATVPIGPSIVEPPDPGPPVDDEVLAGVDASERADWQDRYAEGLRRVVDRISTDWVCLVERAAKAAVVAYLGEMIAACENRRFFERVSLLGDGTLRWPIAPYVKAWGSATSATDANRDFRNIMLRAMTLAGRDKPLLVSDVPGTLLSALRDQLPERAHSALLDQAKLLCTGEALPSLSPPGRFDGGSFSANEVFTLEVIEAWTWLCGGRDDVGRIGELFAARPGLEIDTPFPPPWKLTRP